MRLAVMRLLNTDRIRRILPWLAIVALLALLFGRTLVQQVEFASGPYNLNDDIRIVNYYFLRYADPTLFTQDILGRYHTGGTSELYRALYFVVAKVGLWDEFTRYMPFVLLAICLFGIAAAARAIGGPAAAFVSLALCLSSPLMISRIAGVLPRAFAFPILAWMAAALVRGRIRTIAVLTIVGAGFYPVITVIGLLVLGIVLFLYPTEDRGQASTWSFRRRVVWLTVTTLTCALLTVPFALRMSEYGHAITPAEIGEFPEAGPGGRHDLVTTPPYAPLTKACERVANGAIRGAGPALIEALRDPVRSNLRLHNTLREWLAYVTVLGAALAGLRGNLALRRLAALAAAVGMAYLVALPLAPRLVVPERYTLYGVPVLVVLVVSSFILGFLPAAWRKMRSGLVGTRALAILTCGIVVLGVFGGRGDIKGGLGTFISAEDKPLFTFVARLPSTVLIAGWPQGTMDSLSVATRRTPFLSRELHVPYHSEMTLLMRKRMNALIEAYFATDPAPLIRLHREFGVSHLLVEPSKLESTPRYFRPFQPATVRAQARARARGYEVERQFERCSQFRNEKHVLLDLSCVAAGT